MNSRTHDVYELCSQISILKTARVENLVSSTDFGVDPDQERKLIGVKLENLPKSRKPSVSRLYPFIIHKLNFDQALGWKHIL